MLGDPADDAEIAFPPAFARLRAASSRSNAHQLSRLGRAVRRLAELGDSQPELARSSNLLPTQDGGNEVGIWIRSGYGRRRVDDLAIHIPLAGLVNLAKEKKRLENEILKLDQYVSQVDAKLKNKKFVSNAPDDIVKAEKEKLEKAKEAMVRLQKQLEQLG